MGEKLKTLLIARVCQLHLQVSEFTWTSWSSMWPSPPGLRLEGGRGCNQIKHTRVSFNTWGVWVVLGVLWCFGFCGSLCVFWNLYLPSITLLESLSSNIWILIVAIDEPCHWLHWFFNVFDMSQGGDGICQYVSNVQIPRMNSPRYEQMNACLTLVSSCLSSLRTIF